MPKESYLYDANDTNLYKTDGYSGASADVDNTERYTADIDLTVQTGAIIDFKFDGDNGTDDLIITIYKRRDSTWGGNEIGWKGEGETVSNDGTEKVWQYTIPENYQPGHYRFGMKSEGAATTFEMQVDMRTWRKTNMIT